MSPRVYRIARTIAEQPRNPKHRWVCRETGRGYRTAMGALKAMQREAKMFANGQLPGSQWAMVQTVTWVPQTAAGRAIVKAITA